MSTRILLFLAVLLLLSLGCAYGDSSPVQTSTTIKIKPPKKIKALKVRQKAQKKPPLTKTDKAIHKAAEKSIREGQKALRKANKQAQQELKAQLKAQTKALREAEKQTRKE
jgi:hypothetical protein